MNTRLWRSLVYPSRTSISRTLYTREQDLEFLIAWPSEASVEFYEHHRFTHSEGAMELYLTSEGMTKES